uniref:KIAA0825 n=3 Tax=Anser TaxID=8842 RepID=A0A8B9HYN8_9AVES
MKNERYEIYIFFTGIPLYRTELRSRQKILNMEWGGEYSLDSSNLDCLLNVLPGESEFQQVLNDIDEKIKKNSSSMEQCLKDLQSEVNEICTDEILQSTNDCLQWLNNCNFISLRPSSTPHGELMEFLRTLQSLLKNEQNQEEMILQFLLDLSSQCGVSFPCTPSGTSFEFTSSIHAIEDDSTMDMKSLWDDVRLHLRRFLVNRLQSQEETNTNASQQQIQFKTQCIQQLLFLYPESEVLTRYQNMQNKLVSDLLQNCILSGCGETNFDKVVHGYQSSIPTLCTMIKEDFYVLSGTIDPSSSLKFINETYLDTITEEITVLLERLCELQFKENALHIVKANKISKKHRGTVHAVASQEYHKKGRNFCLTLYQLKCLSQLIKHFLLMEEKIEELSTEILLVPLFTEKNKNVEGVLKKASGELLIGETRANETNVLPEQLLQVKEPTLLNFGWRNAFKDLSSSVAHCITIAIEDFSTKILQHEQKEQSSAAGYAMSLVNNQQMRESCRAVQPEEQPKRIAKFCSDIMEELDTLLPLALACRDDSLQEIRANFIEACSKVATAVLARLEEKSKDVPSKAPPQNLYAALSTAIYVFQHFTMYSNLMRENSKKPLFLVPVQQYQEFINVLQFQVTNYCVRVCATSILQDAESHHWDDYKAFYEGERCSFSVQMWHYFCCALHHDLWTILPPKLAQEILMDVLEQSLAVLSSRYMQACPSYKRTPQIRIDIAAILMSTENMLWSVCSSVQEFLNPHEDRDLKIYKIHTHCNNLLSVLAILTSPLKNLYETFMNNSGEHLPQVISKDFYHPLHWLFCIPSSFPSLLKSPSAGEMAAQGQLKLLLSQPHCNLHLLLETLLHHDCLLVRILLRSSRSEVLNCDERSSLSEQINKKEPTMIETIFTVLSHCILSPKSLGIAFETYMEKEHLWDYLYSMTVSSCGELEPEVIRCLKLTLINSVKGIVKQIISLMHSWEATENYGTYQHKQIVPESLLKTVPKEWNYTPREMKRKESGKCFTRLAAQAVSIVISKLPTVIACLPPPIKYFFFLAERKMSRNFAELKKAGLLVWNLIVIICRIFEDGNTAELLTGATLDRWSKEKLSLIRVCLESIMGKQKSGPKQVTQKVIQSIEQQRPNWIESQLLKARKLSTDCGSVAVEGAPLEEEGIALGFTEQKINMMVLDICHKPGGSEYLRQIYHIIQLNEEYLQEQLSCKNYSEESVTSNQCLPLTLKGREEQAVFNPFQVYSQSCAKVFNQSTITEWNWDWSNFLPNYLGLKQMTFRVLLAHRRYLGRTTVEGE